MTVFIDADGCPVVDITVALSGQAGADCVILCDTSHMIEKTGTNERNSRCANELYFYLCC